MDSLSLLFSSSSYYPISFSTSISISNKNHPKTQKLSNSALQSSSHPHFPSHQTHSRNSLQNLFLPQNLLLKSCFSFTVIDLFTAFPCLAAEGAPPPSVESDAGKINLEAILVSIDDFFNRYPFFVAGITFIWLVVIPLTQEYFKKYKFVSAIDAFRKLRDDPDVQLLDIRDRKNIKFLGSPNLMLLKKEVVQVEFSDDNEDGFVTKVMEKFKDPPNTVLCILDSFDGNSLKVAELLFKKAFKEAYAIKGGVRGQQGWMAIQDSLLPPSVHIKRRKKRKDSQVSTNGNGAIQQNYTNYESASSPDIPAVENQKTDNGHVKNSAEVKSTSVASSSPYPNYPDLKPPSSPTPSKPQL